MTPHEEAEHVTGSTEGAARVDRQALATHSICKMLMAVVAALLLAGCASSVRRVPQPRTGDAAALRSEADASPASAEPLYQLALLHYGEQRLEEALLALDEALGRDRDYEPALTLLAKLLHETGRSFEGIGYFTARPLHEWPASVRLNLALLYADTGNTVEARRILEDLRAGVYADQAQANLAYLDLLDEDDAVARANLEELIGRNIDSPEVLNNLAVARMRSGDIEGSAHILQRLTARHSGFVPAQVNLALLLRHYLFDDEGAARVELYFDELVAPRLSDAVMRQFLDPNRVEDTAPAVQPGVSEGESESDPETGTDSDAPNELGTPAKSRHE